MNGFAGCFGHAGGVAWPAGLVRPTALVGELGAAEVRLARSAALGAVHDGPSAAFRNAVLVLADGWLVGREELAERLQRKGCPLPTSVETADWISAGYEALGREIFALLEGEYAALVWDSRSQSVFASSDVSGRRPIYWALEGGRLLVADRAASVAAMLGTRAVDTQVLAERASLFVGSARRTAWRDVHRVGAGDLLEWRPAMPAPEVTAAQRYAPFTGGDGASSAEAERQLGSLLARAVHERMAPAGLSTVWMSGGYDSTSIFASGRTALANPSAQQLEPVSISYPVGSAGREDELIAVAAARWQAPVHWLTLGESDALADEFEMMLGTMDDAFVHLYGFGMQALARRTRTAGAGVGLCGYGGDAVFYAAPDAYLQDLVGRGQLREAWREFRAFGMGGRRGFFRRAVLPVLPSVLVAPLARLASIRPPAPLFGQVPVPWVRGAGVDSASLARIGRTGGVPRRRGESADAWTIRFMLESPFFQRVQEALQRLARAEGVSHRSPIMDRRVVDFMARRPRADRASAGETKRLLRAAMRERLPAELTGPRAVRTGVPSDVLEGAARRTIERFAASGGPERLVTLGVVDPVRFAEAQARYLQAKGGSAMLGLHLLASIAAERWVEQHG